MSELGNDDLAVNPPGSQYPFYSPSLDIEGLFQDAWVYHYHKDFQPPLSLYYVQGFSLGDSSTDLSESGADNSTYVQIVDATGYMVFDGSDGFYEVRSWSDQFDVHEWRNPQGICRLLRDRTVDCPNTLHPVSADLDARTYVYQPARLDGIIINNSVLQESIDLRNGYNTTLAITEPQTTYRSATGITLAATPGSGEGVFFGCGIASNYVATINSVSPNEVGDIAIVGEECTWIKPGFTYGTGDEALPENGTLRIGDECVVCCECDDYVNTYQAWAKLVKKFHLIGNDVEEFRNQYLQILDTWAELTSCGQDIPVRLGLISQGANMLTISVTAVNWRKGVPCSDLVVTIKTLATQWQGAAVIPYGGVLVMDPNGAWYSSNVSGTSAAEMSKGWTAVPASGTVAIKITLQYPTPAFGTDIAVEVEASVTSGGVPAPNSVTKSIHLLTGTTGGMVVT